jgi:TetR/AcrR family transcriptional repressor of mexJK operon
MLEAAKAVFIEDGYADTTLDEVIRRSGGSRATLYKQFGDKEGLFAAIISDLCAEIVTPLANSASGQEPEAVLLAFGRAFMTGLMEPSGLALYRVLIGEAVRFPELAAAVYRAGPAVAAEELAKHLRRWIAEKQIRLADPDLAARQFLELIKGDLHFRALLRLEPHPTAAEIDACVRSAVRLFLEGVTKR